MDIRCSICSSNQITKIDGSEYLYVGDSLGHSEIHYDDDITAYFCDNDHLFYVSNKKIINLSK